MTNIIIQTFPGEGPALWAVSIAGAAKWEALEVMEVMEVMEVITTRRDTESS